MRPFIRRQKEARTELNPQLRASLTWWIDTLNHGATPREIPRTLHITTYITYSDGEGSDAGVGVAVWGGSLGKPLAAFLTVPREVRLLWTAQRNFSPAGQRDIFEIEAVGPLVILATWPGLLTGSYWIHFIDNTAAQASLVKGSSSVMSGDAIVGITWGMVAHQRIMPWFDRVDSKSNPVDGLSRGRTTGPWQEVRRGRLPGELLRSLRRNAF